MYKQVIIVNSDLKMSKGKLASQVAHASLMSYLKGSSDMNRKWLDNSYVKIILKANLETIKGLDNLFNIQGIPHFLVVDEGRTEIEPNTITCLGISPMENEKVDKYINNLKLL